jgi:hypothetical protein
MKVTCLTPTPAKRELFAWSRHSTVPAKPGCYVLATFADEVLYVGLASVSVRDRMGNHLDNIEKRAVGALGAAYWFYYHLCDSQKVASIERGWINNAILETGSRPPLNKIDSPL